MCQGFMFLRKKECCASYLLSKKMQDKFYWKKRKKKEKYRNLPFGLGKKSGRKKEPLKSCC